MISFFARLFLILIVVHLLVDAAKNNNFFGMFLCVLGGATLTTGLLLRPKS